MAITEIDALVIVPLSLMKLELRIPDSEASHDLLLTAQIVSAVSFAAQSTGATDLQPLRAAAVAIVRAQYDGGEEVKETAAHNAWMAPFRSYKRG